MHLPQRCVSGLYIHKLMPHGGVGAGANKTKTSIRPVSKVRKMTTNFPLCDKARIFDLLCSESPLLGLF